MHPDRQAKIFRLPHSPSRPVHRSAVGFLAGLHLEYPTQIQKTLTYAGIPGVILLARWIGFRLFRDEEPDVQPLELDQNNPDKDNPA